MRYRAAHLSLAAALVLSTVLAVIRPAVPAAASHLPPSEILIRLGELPAGFEPFEEVGVASALPDGLARQAASSFRRETGEPGVNYVRQVVLYFDDRDAGEYVERFKSLLVKHQGYATAGGDETELRLIRTRGEQTSAVVGQAHGEALVLTTVAGPAGTVGPDDAASLTRVAIGRVPVVELTSAAVNSDPKDVALANAQAGPGHLDIPSQQDAVHWPQPAADLPGPPSISIVQARSQRPVPDQSLTVLMPQQRNQIRPANRPADLKTYAQSIEPLVNQFWSRAISMTDVDYLPPGFVVISEGETVYSACSRLFEPPIPMETVGYCLLDQTVYVYEPLMRDEQLVGPDWRSRDFAVAVIIAHEWGHHIQNIRGLSELSIILNVNQPDLAPLFSRQQEVQADCYAGLFTRYARDNGWLSPGDLEKAREAMIRAGDTEFQSAGHHGTAEQRREWFMRGYNHYTLRDCEAW